MFKKNRVVTFYVAVTRTPGKFRILTLKNQSAFFSPVKSNVLCFP